MHVFSSTLNCTINAIVSCASVTQYLQCVFCFSCIGVTMCLLLLMLVSETCLLQGLLLNRACIVSCAAIEIFASFLSYSVMTVTFSCELIASHLYDVLTSLCTIF